MATFVHNTVNIKQAPKLFKEQIVKSVNINKFQMNEPLRIYNHYGEENHHLFTFIQDF